MSFSLAAMQTLMAQETGEVIVATVTFSHPDMAAPFRFCMDTLPITSLGADYTPAFMDVVLVSSGTDQLSQSRLLVGGADQTMLDALDGLPSPATIDIRIVMRSEPDTVMAQNLGLRLAQFSTDASTGIIEMTLAAPSNYYEQYPSIRMDRRRTPGLFTS